MSKIKVGKKSYEKKEVKKNILKLNKLFIYKINIVINYINLRNSVKQTVYVKIIMGVVLLYQDSIKGGGYDE